MLSEVDMTRWLEGVLATLKATVIPAIEDDYVREQTVAAYVLVRHAKNWIANASSGPRESLGEVRDGAIAGARLIADADRGVLADEAVAEYLRLVGVDDERPHAAPSLQDLDRMVKALWNARDALTDELFAETRQEFLEGAARAVANDIAMLGRTAAPSRS